ncbi:hypothetical protein EBR21_04820, partial [bacterium]|nr:hypothetical protein [bacterium]
RFIPPAICSYEHWTIKGENIVQAKADLIKHLQLLALKFDDSKIYCTPHCFEQNTPCPDDYNPTTCVYNDFSFHQVNDCNSAQLVRINFCRGTEKLLDGRQVECVSDRKSNPKIDSQLIKAEKFILEKKFKLVLELLSPVKLDGQVLPPRADAKRHFLLSQSYGQLKQYENAIEHCRKALRFDGNLHIAEYNIAVYTALKGDATGALWLLNKLSSREPISREAIFKNIQTEPDLKSLRGLKDFEDLKARFEELSRLKHSRRD